VHVLVPPGKLRELLVYPLQHHHPVTFAKLLNLADTIGNILLFFPLGVGVFFAFRRFSPDSVRAPLIVALFLGLLLSIGIETFQYLVPNRIPSVSDTIANAGGAVFGCYLLCFRKMYKESKRF
jgi:VanZ family protein